MPLYTGAAITNWVAYTPTFSAGFGSVSAVTVLSRRVGQNLEVMGTVTAGTVAASGATVTPGFNGSNANVTIDSTVIGATYPCGDWGTTNSNFTSGKMVYSSTTVVGFGQSILTTVGGTTAAASLQVGNVSAMGGNANQVQFRFSVPIVGWAL